MVLEQKNRELAYFGLPQYTVDSLMAICATWREKFGNKIIDSLPVVRQAYEEGKKILLEGQLGVMRDLDWGIYPYTTSSSPTSGGAAVGSGLGPGRVHEVIGVTKVYSTSVGGGPFMTELFDDDGKKLQTIGREFGATTGRPRRCGWFDAVAVDFSAWVNGFTALALTKLDVLDTFETIKICTGYSVNGEVINHLPETAGQEVAIPIYEEVEGWMRDTTAARKWEDLPPKAQAFCKRLEELIHVPIKFISVGPERDQIIIM
jgi:adenylosuccinate synthase